MVVFLVGKDTLKISEAYINAFPAFSCPLFASKNPIVKRFKNGGLFDISGCQVVRISLFKLRQKMKGRFLMVGRG